MASRPEGTGRRSGASSSKWVASGQGRRRCSAGYMSSLAAGVPSAMRCNSGPSHSAGSAESTSGHGSPKWECRWRRRSFNLWAFSLKEKSPRPSSRMPAASASSAAGPVTLTGVSERVMAPAALTLTPRTRPSRRKARVSSVTPIAAGAADSSMRAAERMMALPALDRDTSAIASHGAPAKPELSSRRARVPLASK